MSRTHPLRLRRRDVFAAQLRPRARNSPCPSAGEALATSESGFANSYRACSRPVAKPETMHVLQGSTCKESDLRLWIRRLQPVPRRRRVTDNRFSGAR